MKSCENQIKKSIAIQAPKEPPCDRKEGQWSGCICNTCPLAVESNHASCSSFFQTDGRQALTFSRHLLDEATTAAVAQEGKEW